MTFIGIEDYFSIDFNRQQNLILFLITDVTMNCTQLRKNKFNQKYFCL